MLLLVVLVIGYIGWYESYKRCEILEEALIITFQNNELYCGTARVAQDVKSGDLIILNQAGGYGILDSSASVVAVVVDAGKAGDMVQVWWVRSQYSTIETGKEE